MKKQLFIISLLILLPFIAVAGGSKGQDNKAARFVRVEGKNLVRPDGTKLFIHREQTSATGSIPKDICSDSSEPTAHG